MKIRMTTNSIRIRIRKSELDQLIERSEIKDHIVFASDTTFHYSLKLDSEISNLEGDFTNSTINISIPTTLAQQWATTSRVSLEENIRINDTDTLHLLVEKDFPCLDRPEENYNDTFWELSENKDPKC